MNVMPKQSRFSYPRPLRGGVYQPSLNALPGRSADETVREAARLADADGGRWPAEWLRLCGLDAEADALERSHPVRLGPSASDATAPTRR